MVGTSFLRRYEVETLGWLLGRGAGGCLESGPAGWEHHPPEDPLDEGRAVRWTAQPWVSKQPRCPFTLAWISEAFFSRGLGDGPFERPAVLVKHLLCACGRPHARVRA